LESLDRRIRCRAARVEKNRAEEIRRRLLKIGVLNPRLKPFEEDGFIYFPLKEEARISDLLGELKASIVVADFEERIKRPKSLEEILSKKLPKELLNLLPSSYDLIGDIILVEIPPELKPYEKMVAEGLMKLYPSVKTVLSKEGVTKGAYRLREYRVIAGLNKFETIHREHGCIYRIDLRRAFFNPRMSGERIRVARLVSEDEKVLDMFAGIGSFSIVIAKKQPTATIIAIELNPDAYRLMLENIRLNKVKDRVKPILGDCREVLKDIHEKFDRIIMDLPHSSIDYLDLALEKTKRNSIIHLYLVGGGEEPTKDACEKALEKIQDLGFDVDLVYARRVMEIAPRRSTIVLDLRVKDR